MIPLRALKKAVNDKLDKSSDFDPNLTMLRHTHSSISTTTKDDYPYGFYEFSTEDDILALGDNIPVGANIVLTFHLFSLAGQSSNEIEGLIGDLTSKFYNDSTLYIEDADTTWTDTIDNNWTNPSVGILDQNITVEPETSNWHGMVRYTMTLGR